MFLGKTLYSFSPSLHPEVEMDTGELSRKSDKKLWVGWGGDGGLTCDELASYPGIEKVAIL